jgi:tetraacyldisaccharide 4'-kinase
MPEPMRDPAFWWRDRSAAAAVLAPAAAAYGVVSAARLVRPGWRAAIPIVCIGNFTLGGAGKTPTAIAVAKLFIAAGLRPFFLSRGYGGTNRGPLRLDVPATGQQNMASAAHVGDEPLLLGRIAPTIVAHDRKAGAKMAAAAGADVIIMDDGLQNPSLVKDYAIAVVDGRRGIGNGWVFPAGPLRAPLAAQFLRTNALLIVGRSTTSVVDLVGAATGRGLPVFQGELRPDPAAAAALAGQRVLAFAGIADPEKFFITLESCGISVMVRERFADHHRLSARECADLLARAEREHLTLVTTEKDLARMTGDGAVAELAVRTRTLPVTLTFQAEADVAAALLGVIKPRSARGDTQSVLEA